MIDRAKAVLVAKDVIKQIKSGRYVSTEGMFLDDWLYDVMNSRRQSFQKIEAKITKRTPCQVCALGSVVLSYARLFNDWDIDEEFDIAQEGRKRMKTIFGSDTHWIEVAFEGFSDRGEKGNKCRSFHFKHPNKKTRIVSIMQNIIDHKGHFCP